jgi:uncharacterized protein YbcI
MPTSEPSPSLLREQAQAVVGVLAMCLTRRRLAQTRVRCLGPECAHARPAQLSTIVLSVPDEQSDQQGLTPQARVSQEVVRTMKDLYGRGPTHAKTYLCDEYVFCVMSGGMTRDEETMIRGGEEDAVREYRLRFQAVIAPELIRRVEDVLERKVVSYHSQVLFDPDRLVEIFVLDRKNDETTENAGA